MQRQKDSDSQSTKEASPPKKAMRFSTVRPIPATSNSNCSKIVDEFQTYIQEAAVVETDEIFHSIQYWKNNHKRFKFLSIIAVEILGIPASSGQLERIFSTATDILSAKRNRLHSSLFQKLLFIKRNSVVIRSRSKPK